MLTTDLHTPYALAPGVVDDYRERGFVHLRDVLSRATLDSYRDEIAARVRELNTMHLPLAERDTYHRAFLQVSNLWTHSAVVEELVRSERLARIATELMGVEGVRLYHDQALFKEPGGGITPWHVDQHYWPLDSPNTTTVWIPLQDTPVELGALAFAAGSHRFAGHRDLAISDDSEARIAAAMAEQEYPYVQEPFDLGDVSFHAGWTFHRAPPNTSDRVRGVMTVIYIDRDITVAEPDTDAQRHDLATWLPSCEVGGPADGPLNPVLYERGGRPA